MSVLLDGKRHPHLITPITAVSTDTGIQIIYVGSQASATVEVAAGGDMTLKHGASGSEAVDTTIGSPNLDGVFDLSTPAAAVNTYGELVDLINATANWKARLVGVQRSDLTDNTLITRTAAQAKGVVVSLLRDTTVILTATVYAIGNRVGRLSLLGGNDGGIRHWITRIEGIGTSAGAHALKVYSCNPQTKVDTLIFTGTVASATAYEYNDIDFGAMGGLCSKTNEELLVQHEADTATITAPRLQIQGYYEYLGMSAPSRYAVISGQ